MDKKIITFLHTKNCLYRIYGPRREKTCLPGCANIKGSGQPAHPRSLICTFIIRLLVSVISKLVTSAFSLFWLVSVAEETGFKSCFVGNPEDRFSRDEAHMILQLKYQSWWKMSSAYKGANRYIVLLKQ